MEVKKIRVTMERRADRRYRVTAINGALSVSTAGTVGGLAASTHVTVGDVISNELAADIERLRWVTVNVKLAKGAA